MSKTSKHENNKTNHQKLQLFSIFQHLKNFETIANNLLRNPGNIFRRISMKQMLEENSKVQNQHECFPKSFRILETFHFSDAQNLAKFKLQLKMESLNYNFYHFFICHSISFSLRMFLITKTVNSSMRICKQLSIRQVYL